ncbi:uncharacterized protein [Nicotiana tomentosiformis]|uniref:uncharacterized protein n=1 Tax=Nicotiana tomentosiformis TaxID=4098 RepID=UPI00388C5E0D
MGFILHRRLFFFKFQKKAVEFHAMVSVMDNISSRSSTSSDGFTPFTLDSSHPLYVHSSDSPDSQLVVVPFNVCGFVLWRSSMLTSLSAKNKLGLLDGRVSQLSPDSPYYLYWERCNDMVKAWITNSVSRDIATSVMCLKTARELFQFLNGLNDSYSTVKSAIMMMNPLPPINKAYSLLQQDESQKEALSNVSNFSGDSTSFFVSPAQSPNTRNCTQRVNFESRKNVNGVSSKYCKKPGYTVEKYYRLHGFPPEFKFTKNKKFASCVQGDIPHPQSSPAINQFLGNSSPIHGFTKEQYQHLLIMFQQVHVSPGTILNNPSIEDSRFAHFAGLFTAYDVESVDSHVCASSQTNVDPWILDSGSTNHMTLHKHLLHDIMPLVRPFLVTLPNGYKVKGPSLKRPLFTLSDQIMLMNLAVVLRLPPSLLLKGYKLLNMSNSSVFYSRDVIFHEHIFPYSSSSSPSLSSILPSPFVDIPSHPISSPAITPFVVIPLSTSTPLISPAIPPTSTTTPDAPPLRKSTRTVTQPAYLKDSVCSSANSNLSTSTPSKGDLHEEVYMKIPPGLNVTSSSSPIPLVCKLKKSLYGLRQASRQWFSKLSEALLSRCYISSLNDYSLFTKSSFGSLVVLAVYVDDILLAGDDLTEMNSLKSYLDDQFKIKDLGSVHYFLGLEITTHPQGYLMSQHKYTFDLLTEFNCHHFSPLVTPLYPFINLTLDMRDPLPDPSLY